MQYGLCMYVGTIGIEKTKKLTSLTCKEIHATVQGYSAPDCAKKGGHQKKKTHIVKFRKDDILNQTYGKIEELRKIYAFKKPLIH